MDDNRLGFSVKRMVGRHVVEALSRDGVDRLVEDAIHDLAVLKREIAPDGIREYVEANVRINADIGRYGEPSATHLHDALEQSLLELRCARTCNGEPEKADTPSFHR